jgi:hypothetical protein
VGIERRPKTTSPFEGFGAGGMREILVHPNDLQRARELIGLEAN